MFYPWTRLRKPELRLDCPRAAGVPKGNELGWSPSTGHGGTVAPYGQPMPCAGASAVSTWPIRRPPPMFSAPPHSFTVMNNVRRSGPPRTQAKQPRSRSITWSTSPPSRTRTQRLLPTSPYQMAPSASRQMPSGWSSTSAHVRRFDRPPSAAMSKGGELPAVGLRDDEGRIVRGDGHAVGEGEAVGHLASGAVGGDQRHEARG